ncbi:MAG: 2-oxoacid:acceptor oxidoreductase family protein [Candidatus Bathyarchaeia archaeon]
MFEIRWHGRAGQGVITVSRLLGYAALLEGKHVQAFPAFGPERLGAPMMGFTRVSDEPIEIHSLIYEPDIVVVLDDTVPKIVNVTAGLKSSGKILLNSKQNPAQFKKEMNISNRAYTVDATKISFDVLGNARAFNTAMLGGLLKVEPLVSIDSLSRAFHERFRKDLAEKNIEVLKKGYEQVIEA